MMSIKDCLTDNTQIYLVSSQDSKAQGKKIFRKLFNPSELIGEELCKIRNLKCTHYFIIGEGNYHVNRNVLYSKIRRKNYHIKLGSYDFRDFKENEYCQIHNTFVENWHDYFVEILELAPTEENRRQLLDEIEEMFALDTFMGQTDRYFNNIIFSRNRKTKEIHLAPLFDFQYSLKSTFLYSDTIYGNILHSFKDENAYREFIAEHPEFEDKLKAYLDVDLIEVIKRCYRSRGLQLPEEAIPFYREFEKSRKELIKTVTRTK